MQNERPRDLRPGSPEFAAVQVLEPSFAPLPTASAGSGFEVAPTANRRLDWMVTRIASR